MLWPKLAFFAPFVLLFGAAVTSAEPGFQSANSPSVPEAIRRASTSVLQVWTPIAFRFGAAAKYSTIEHNLATMQTNEFRQDIRFQLNREELKYCQAHKLPRCLFTVQVAQGSAFVLPDGTLIAARHNFSQTKSGLQAKFAELAADWAERAKDPSEKAIVDGEIASFKANPLVNAEFILTDARQKIVFNSARQTFRVLRFGELSEVRGEVDLNKPYVGLAGENIENEASSFTGADWIDRDSVRIQLSVRLPALAEAHSGCAEGDPSYVVGFAGQTTNTRRPLGARDAIYNELSVTSGKVLDRSQIEDRSSHWAEAQHYMEAVNQRNILVTDADGTEGVSGGPVLNAYGEVCGMFKAFFPGDEHPHYNSQKNVLEMFTLGIPLEYLTGI